MVIKLSDLLRVVFAAGSLVAAAQAESSYAASSGTSSTSTATANSAAASSTPKIHKVTVGLEGTTYDPNTTFADPGDIIVFEFFPTNHTVIRTEYTDASSCPPGGCNPCVPYEVIHPGAVGFHAPNFLTENIDPNKAVTWNLTVNDTSPVFFYCDALASCHPNGMIGVINPDETVSLEKQFSAAVSAPYQLGPGQSLPPGSNGAGMLLVNDTANATSGAKPSSTNSSTPSSAPSNGGGSHGLSHGAIAGIVIGAVAVLVLAAALFYFVGRSKTYHDMLTGKSATGSAPPGAASQAGDVGGPWSPALPMSSGGGTFAGDGAGTYSQIQGPTSAMFVGYNRQTGAPEFASEAPLVEAGDSKGAHESTVSPVDRLSSPRYTVELPGDAPAMSEAPPRKY